MVTRSLPAPTVPKQTEDRPHASGDQGIMLLGVVNEGGQVQAAEDDYCPITVDPAGRLIIGTVLNFVPGTDADDLGKAEDAPHASGDTGVMALAVRRDAAAASSGTDGDYEPLSTDSSGRLRTAPSANPGVDIGDVDVASIAAGDNNIGNVDIVTMPNVTLAAGTNTNEVVGDVAHDAPIAGNPLVVGGVASAAAPADVSGDQDAVRAWHLRNGAQATVLTAAGALIGGDAANGLDVDVTRLPALVAGTANIGGVSGDVAHDSPDSGNPLKIGLKAIAHGANPTAVAAADRTDWYASRAGVPFVMGGHPNIVTLELAATGAQTDVAVVTVAGGLKIVVTEIEALCDHANTVDVGVRVGFGATTTPTTTGVVLTHPGIAAGSGVTRGSGSGILGVGADGEDLRVTSEVPTGGSLRILVSYYTVDS